MSTSTSINELSADQAVKAAERDHQVLEAHSSKADIYSEDVERLESLEVRRKKPICRSNQRGRLEVDLLLGSWATENVPGTTAKEMDDHENIF